MDEADDFYNQLEKLLGKARSEARKQRHDCVYSTDLLFVLLGESGEGPLARLIQLENGNWRAALEETRRLSREIPQIPRGKIVPQHIPFNNAVVQATEGSRSPGETISRLLEASNWARQVITKSGLDPELFVKNYPKPVLIASDPSGEASVVIASILGRQVLMTVGVAEILLEKGRSGTITSL